MIYVASTYTVGDASPELMQQRFEFVEKWVAEKMKTTKLPIFSPILYNHKMAIDYDMPKDWSFWGEVDEAFLYSSSTLIVLKMPMWEESVGITAEIKFAEEKGIPIIYEDVDYTG